MRGDFVVLDNSSINAYGSIVETLIEFCHVAKISLLDAQQFRSNVIVYAVHENESRDISV